MKYLLLLITLVLLCHCPVSAQWYERACAVHDLKSATSDEFDCMWDKAAKTVKAGQITCLVGSSIAILGGAVSLVASGTDSEAASGTTMIGATVAIGGLAVTAISIPIWATGASRKSKLMKTPAYQDHQEASLQISPLIETNHFTRQASLGLAVSLNF